VGEIFFLVKICYLPARFARRGIKKMTDKMVERLTEHLHIDNFRKITADTMGENVKGRKEKIGFFRKGQIGDWKNHLAENEERWNDWILENNQEMDIKFKFE
jgi:hypothetical protein